MNAALENVARMSATRWRQTHHKQNITMKMKPLTTLLVLAALIGATAFTLTANAADKAKPYPLDKCVVSGEKLGTMGKPYVFTHEGQEIRLCCKSCLKDFQKEPAAYLKKLTVK